MSKPIRVIVGKVGLDGHDRGAKAVAVAFRNAGFEVIYTGLRQTPEMVVETALQEDVDVVGISMLSGAHCEIMERICELLRENGAGDMLVVLGGNVPDRDRDALTAMGVDGIFATSSKFDEMQAWICERVEALRANRGVVKR